MESKRNNKYNINKEFVKNNLNEIKKGLRGITERIVLLGIVICVWIFLDLFQNRLPGLYAVIFLMAGVTIYAIYMQISFKYKRRKQKKNPQIINENYKPFVSILIPAHNEEFVIINTVETVLKLDYPNFEIIVIDDRSSDNTALVISQLDREYEKVKSIIRSKDAFPGKSAVLNEALSIAKGEAILVFDADAYVEPDFLSKLIPYLEPPDIGAVQARKVIVNRDENFLTRCQDNEFMLDTHFQVGRDAVKGAVELRGNGELIKRKALDDINGWNNYTITDDLDMSTRLHIKGWDIRFCSSVCVYEEGILNISSLLKQRRRWIEGAIRRYLENFKSVLMSRDISLRTRVDMIAYIIQFVMPFTWVSEIVIQIMRELRGLTAFTQASLILSVVICIFYMIGLTYSIRHYKKINLIKSLIQGLETSIYFVILWFPLVFFILFKIIFCKKTMYWGKTTHGISKFVNKIISKELYINKTN